MKRIRRFLKFGLLVALALFALLNGFAYLHAYKMTHFVDAGERTPSPEELSLGDKLKVVLTGTNIPKPTGTWTLTDLNPPLANFKVIGYDQLVLDVLHMERERASTAIILWHGYAGEKTQVAREAREFYAAGYDVYVADFHGSGESSGNTTSIGYHEAEDVRAVFTEVRRRHPEHKVILYGVSMGANAIINAMYRFRIEPSAAILASPFSSLLDTVSNRFASMGLPAFPAAHCLVFWGGVQQDYPAFDYEPHEFAKSISTPVLQLHGITDERVTTEGARRVFDSFAGPKEWQLFTKSGHEPLVQTEPDKWRECVFRFVEAL